MRRIEAAPATCPGLGMGEAIAADLFEVGPDEIVVVLDEHPDDGGELAAVDPRPMRASGPRAES